MTTKSRRDVTDPVDLVFHCAAKIKFLTDFFCTGKPDSNFEFSTQGSSGLVFILGDLAEELNFIGRKMTEGTGERLQNSIQNARDKGEI